MDPLVQVAAIGIATTIITTLGIVIVAVVNSKKERADTADSAIERTLRERLVLRDEQIADLRDDVKDRDGQIQKKDDQIKSRDALIEEMRVELVERKKDV